jgi:hypothetical protein
MGIDTVKDLGFKVPNLFSTYDYHTIIRQALPTAVIENAVQAVGQTLNPIALAGLVWERKEKGNGGEL